MEWLKKFFMGDESYSHHLEEKKLIEEIHDLEKVSEKNQRDIKKLENRLDNLRGKK